MENLDLLVFLLQNPGIPWTGVKKNSSSTGLKEQCEAFKVMCQREKRGDACCMNKTGKIAHTSSFFFLENISFCYSFIHLL